MFKIKNERTGKFVRNAIDGNDFVFESKEHAEKFASGCERSSVTDGTAFNRVRPSKFTVIKIGE